MFTVSNHNKEYMKMKKIILMLCAALLLTAGPALAGPDIEAGSWEISMTMNMAGMPLSIPPMVFTTCLTEEDLVPQDSSTQMSNPDCSVMDIKIKGNTVTWNTQCDDPDGGKMTSSGEITYSGSSFTGKTTINMNNPDQGPMTMTQTMTGKRVGPCPQ